MKFKKCALLEDDLVHRTCDADDNLNCLYVVFPRLAIHKFSVRCIFLCSTRYHQITTLDRSILIKRAFVAMHEIGFDRGPRGVVLMNQRKQIYDAHACHICICALYIKQRMCSCVVYSLSKLSCTILVAAMCILDRQWHDGLSGQSACTFRRSRSSLRLLGINRVFAKC